jgi:hypothetical protein
MNTLPAEIIDRVIDHLHNDQDSLKVTSLTCRRWLPRSQYHLFHGVQLDPVDFYGFLRLVDGPRGIGNLIHRLIVKPATEYPRSTAWIGQQSALPSLNIRILRLYQNTWEHLTPAFMEFLYSLETVEVLELVCVNFTTFAQLESLVFAFPQLNVVRLIGVRVLRETIPPPHPHPEDRNLIFDLDIFTEHGKSGAGEVVSWLSAREMIRCVRSFRTPLSWDGAITIDSTFTSAVRHLHVVFPDSFVFEGATAIRRKQFL